MTEFLADGPDWLLRSRFCSITPHMVNRTSLVPPTSRPNKTNLEFKSDQQDKSGTVKKETTFNCATRKRLREPSGQSSQGQGQMKYPRMS